VIVTVPSKLDYYTFGSSDERVVCKWTAFCTGQHPFTRRGRLSLFFGTHRSTDVSGNC
jgi:hypothetical protein